MEKRSRQKTPLNLYLVLWGALIYLNLLDGIASAYFVSRTSVANELNPLMRWLMQGAGLEGFLLVKIGVGTIWTVAMGAIALRCLQRGRKNHRLFWAVIVCFSIPLVMYSLVAIQHFRNLYTL